MRRRVRGIFVAVRVFVVLAVLWTGRPVPAAQPAVKNVIVLIADGCASEQYTLARWFKGEPLHLDAIRVGAVKTYISDSVIADSAPTGSAYATGVRTSDKFISVGPKPEVLTTEPVPPPEWSYRPLATVLEGARLLGKATGVVSTSRVSHATPAAYLAHVPSRTMEADIMEQAVYQGVDVVLGGGKAYLLPADRGGERLDRENLVDVLRRRGYAVIERRGQLAAVESGKVFGMFADGHMAAEIDRPELAPHEPTLEEMTRKAIELLSRNPKGFFLMVEASQIDWACHANDPAHLLSDLLMYDRAVGAALDFARRDQNTLVLALSDHNTGGMSIGNRATNGTYSQTTLEALLNPLRRMKASSVAMWASLDGDATPQNVKRVVAFGWGMEITDADADRIVAVAKRDADAPHNGFGEVLCSRYTCIGWTTHGHTGGDVPLFAFGPGRPVGLVDGPDVGRITARALGLDLDRLNERLFQEAASALGDATVSIDRGDENNPVVVIDFEGKTARLPVNKNLLELDGRTIALEGVVVYAPNTRKAYLPLEAVKQITGIGELPPVGP